MNKNHNLEQLIQVEFEKWIETYIDENISDNEKILSYEISSIESRPTFDTSGIIMANVRFKAETASENSIWNNFVDGESNYFDLNICYIELEVLDDNNYQINYIGREPKNLVIFQERFEEYKNQNKEIIVFSAEDINYLSSEKVIKISNIINITTSILIVLSVLFLIFKIIKLKK